MKEKVIDTEKIKLALSELKIGDRLSSIQPVDQQPHTITNNAIHNVPRRVIDIYIPVAEITRFAVGYTGWLVGSLASIAIKVTVFAVNWSFVLLASIVASISRSISRGLNKGFVDYDWSKPEAGSNPVSSKGGFKHTTTYQDITITVEKP